MAVSGICIIDDCGNPPINSRGWCRAHYLRWLRHGDPCGGRKTRPNETVEWLDVCAAHDGDDCLIWPYSTNHGYAQTWMNGKPALATRIICEKAHGGPPSERHDAAHSCGRGAEGCVNPRHLRWATRTENEADKMAHGTHGKKLSAEDVIEIRRLKGTMSNSAIARKFGVSGALIGMIYKGHAWASLNQTTRERV